MFGDGPTHSIRGKSLQNSVSQHPRWLGPNTGLQDTQNVVYFVQKPRKIPKTHQKSYEIRVFWCLNGVCRLRASTGDRSIHLREIKSSWSP